MRVFELTVQLKCLFDRASPGHASVEDDAKLVVRWGPRLWEVFRRKDRVERRDDHPALWIIVARMDDLKEALASLKIIKKERGAIKETMWRARIGFRQRGPPPPYYSNSD